MKDQITELWTIESGQYSDHSVLAVFAAEADAKAWLQAVITEPHGYNSDAYIGRMLFVPAGVDPFLVTVYRRHVELWDDGRVVEGDVAKNTSLAITSYEQPPKRPRVRYVRTPIHKAKGGRLEVVAATETEVLKVCSERIAAWKAGTWAGPGFGEITEE